MPPAVRALVVSAAFACVACRSGGSSPRPAAVPPGAPINHPPQVRALCDPCTVAAGGAVRLKADAKDADGDTLIYVWSAPAGSPAPASAKDATWTAPSTAGPVPVTVRVSDGKGGIASDVVTITVMK